MRKFSIALLAGTALLTTQAFAADLIIETPMEPGVVTVSGNWDGAYLGVFGGYASGELTDAGTADIDGWLVGFAAGYDVYLADSIVGGIVADIAWNDIADATDTFTSDWNGSLRARLGYDAGAFLPYVTGGLAFISGNDATSGDSNTHWGWTVGAGVEVAVSEQLSLDLQYRYTDYATAEYGGFDVGATTHAATVGLNWRF